MLKLFKNLLLIVFSFVLVVVLLLVILVGTVFYLIDPNVYKPEITQTLSSLLQRKVEINGDIQLTLAPLGFDLNKVLVHNPDDFEATEFAQLGKTSVYVQWTPLLQGQVAINEVILDTFKLHLVRNEAGKTNWEDLISKQTAQNSSDDTSPSEETPSTTDEQSDEVDTEIETLENQLSIKLAGLRINNAEISWHDKQTGQHYSLSQLNLTTGAINFPFTKPIDMQLATDLASTGDMPLTAHLTLKTQADLNLSQQQYKLAPLSLMVDAEGAAIPGQKQQAKLDTQVVVDLKQQTATVDKLTLQALDTLNLTANLHVSKLLSNPTVEGALQLAEFNPRQVLKQLNITLPAMVQDDMLQQAALQARYQGDVQNGFEVRDMVLSLDGQQSTMPLAKLNLPQQTVTVPTLKANYLDVELKVADFKLTEFSAPHMNAAIIVAPFNLRKLVDRLKLPLPATTDPNVLTHLMLNTKLSLVGNQPVRLQPTTLQLDDSHITGQLSVQPTASMPALTFNLNLDKIDLNRYMPPASSKEASPSVLDPDAPLLPNELIRQLDLDGVLKVTEMQVPLTTLRDVKVTVKAKDGVVDVDSQVNRLYEGRYNGKLKLDTKQAQPQVHLIGSVQKLQAAPLLRDLIQRSDLSGLSDLQFNLSTNVSNMNNALQTLTGNIDFAFRDGALYGFNITEAIQKAKATFEGKSLEKFDETQQKTDFSNFSGMVQFKDGKMLVDEVALKSSLLNILGSGNIGIIDQKLNFTLNTTLVEEVVKQGFTELKDLVGVNIPIKISGTALAPKLAPEIDKVLGELVKAKLKQEKEKVKQQVDKAVGDAVKEFGLDKLFQ